MRQLGYFCLASNSVVSLVNNYIEWLVFDICAKSCTILPHISLLIGLLVWIGGSHTWLVSGLVQIDALVSSLERTLPQDGSFLNPWTRQTRYGWQSSSWARRVPMPLNGLQQRALASFYTWGTWAHPWLVVHLACRLHACTDNRRISSYWFSFGRSAIS